MLWCDVVVGMRFCVARVLVGRLGRAVAERSALCGQRRISSDLVAAAGGSTSSRASVLVERAFHWGSRLGSRFDLLVSDATFTNRQPLKT